MAGADPQFDVLPPRWRTVRRVLIGFAGLLSAVAVLRGYSGRVTSVRFVAAEAAARAAGRPWTAADLQHPATAPADDAAPLFRQAAALVVKPPSGPTNDVTIPGDPTLPAPRLNAAWRAAADRAAAAHGPAFELFRRAAARPDCDWHTPWITHQGSLMSVMLPYLMDARILSTEAADHALWLHFRGRDVEALQTVADLLTLARAVGNDRMPVNEQAAASIITLACERAETIALDLAPGEAADAAVRRLMLRLADTEAGVFTAAAVAVAANGVMYKSAYADVAGQAWLLRPIADRVVADFTDEGTAAADLLQRGEVPGPYPSTPQTRRFQYWKWPGTQWPVTPPWRPDDSIRNNFGWYLTRVGRASRDLVRELRLARVLLALRLFKNAEGRWPASTDALVPAYLPAVPRGTARPERTRLEFVVLPRGRPDGGPRPMVYVDGDNDHNAPPADREAVGTSDERSFRRHDDRDGRQWRDADAWPASAFSSAQPLP